MTHLLNGTWAVVTINDKPGRSWKSPNPIPWSFIFKDNMLRYVVIRGGLYILVVDGLYLDTRMSPTDQVKSIIDYFAMNPFNYDLLSAKGDPIKILKEMGASTSFINELGLKKTTSRTVRTRK